jgi:hypothetical protein
MSYAADGICCPVCGGEPEVCAELGSHEWIICPACGDEMRPRWPRCVTCGFPAGAVTTVKGE